MDFTFHAEGFEVRRLSEKAKVVPDGGAHRGPLRKLQIRGR